MIMNNAINPPFTHINISHIWSLWTQRWLPILQGRRRHFHFRWEIPLRPVLYTLALLAYPSRTFHPILLSGCCSKLTGLYITSSHCYVPPFAISCDIHPALSSPPAPFCKLPVLQYPSSISEDDKDVSHFNVLWLYDCILDAIEGLSAILQNLCQLYDLWALLCLPLFQWGSMLISRLSLALIMSSCLFELRPICRLSPAPRQRSAHASFTLTSVLKFLEYGQTRQG